MTPREKGIRQARRIIPDDQLRAFLRAIRKEKDILAVKLINDQLDEGDSLDTIFCTGDDYGFQLSVTRGADLSLEIAFGCVAGPEAGDGGEWQVTFDDRGRVKSVKRGSQWIS